MKHFPKVELHRHLEGSFPLDIIYKIAKKNRIPVPKSLEEFKSENQFPRDSEPDFLLFLSKFRNHWYRTLQDISTITYNAVKNFESDGLFYLELRFNPVHFAAQNDFDRKVVTKRVISAGNKAAKEIGLRIKYLITMNRGQLSSEEMISLYEYIKDTSPHICGFDLAGDESSFPPEKFTTFFEHLNKDGKFKTTVHAGEVSPASQIWDSINMLDASRIGHGTSTIHDKELQKHLKKKGIVLEQCLTSNYQTGSWVDTATHPFGRLFKSGVPVTLNSDDPTIQDADLTDDYILAVKHFGLSLDDLVKMNLIAIKSSFLNPSAKRRLKKDYLQAVEDFKAQYFQ